MADTRFKDLEWDLADSKGHVGTWERVQVAVLMDVRDELKQLNALLQCGNFRRIPATLKKIANNTSKRTRKKSDAAR